MNSSSQKEYESRFRITGTPIVKFVEEIESKLDMQNQTHELYIVSCEHKRG